jgi:hypothetical protein
LVARLVISDMMRLLKGFSIIPRGDVRRRLVTCQLEQPVHAGQEVPRLAAGDPEEVAVEALDADPRDQDLAALWEAA